MSDLIKKPAAILDLTLTEVIDEYCLAHALKYNHNISAIWDAKQLALETDDHLKTELNHKILQELMESHTHRMLFEEMENRGYVIHT